MRFCRQAYWSGLPFSPGDLPSPGIEPRSPALQADSLPTELHRKLTKAEVCSKTICGRPGFNSWVGKFPWRRKWQPTPVLLLGESHGQRSLAGCSGSWGSSVHGLARVGHDLALSFFLSALLRSSKCLFGCTVIIFLYILIMWVKVRIQISQIKIQSD